MRLHSGLSALVIAGTLAALPAQAKDRDTARTPEDRATFPYGAAITGPADDTRTPQRSALTEGTVIEGTVAGVDRAEGRLVIDTEGGLVSLVTWPDEVSGIDVGDFVKVSFVSDDRR